MTGAVKKERAPDRGRERSLLEILPPIRKEKKKLSRKAKKLIVAGKREEHPYLVQESNRGGVFLSRSSPPGGKNISKAGREKFFAPENRVNKAERGERPLD